MAVVPRIKCGRCDRSFSGLRNRCPYCGARRSKGGKRVATDSGDPKARLIIGVLLLAAIVLTVIGMIRINLGGDDPVVASPAPSQGVITQPDATPSPSTSPTATPAPTPTPATVSSVDVTWPYDNGLYEMTINVGDTVVLTGTVYPNTAEEQIKWGVDKSSVCTIKEESGDNTKATLTAEASGEATVYIEAGGKRQELVVRVN